MSDQIQQMAQEFQSLEVNSLYQKYNNLCQSNYLKNIARAFVRYILENGEEIIITSLTNSYTKSLTQLRREFQQFMKYKSYNQSTLFSILKSQRFGQVFSYFLKFYSQSWLQESPGIKDTSGHLICIEFLIRGQEQSKILEKFKVYKKIQKQGFKPKKKSICK